MHIEILLCAMSQADPEMKINMQMMGYETAPGRTCYGSEGKEMRKRPCSDTITGKVPAWPDPSGNSSVSYTSRV